MRQMMIIAHPQFGEVRNVMVKGEPWFAGKDVCAVLGIANHKDALGRLDENERQGVGITDPLGKGGLQTAIFINESGVYSLIFQSRKPEAKAFRKWVTSEVLPSIRKYGYYIDTSAQVDRKQLNAIKRSHYAMLGKYVTDEDVRRVAKRFGKSVYYIESVLGGKYTDNDVMRTLQDIAQRNHDSWVDCYTVERMNEVIDKLR